MSTESQRAGGAVASPLATAPGEATAEPGPAAEAEAAEKATAPRRLFTRADLAIYGCYALAALAVVSPLWRHVGWRTMYANSTDHQQALWFIAHAANAVTHGHNPLFSNQLNAPEGVNMMGNTSMLGLGVPAIPVTILFGPRVAFALLLTFCIAGTAAAWYVVFRRGVVRSRVAAAIAGGFCGFAPGLISHAQGQLNFTAQFLLPFIVLTVMRLGEPRHGLRRSVTLALLIAYQVFINEELLLLYAAGCGVFVISYAALRWSQVRGFAATYLRRLGLAAVIAAVLLAYPLWFQFFGPRHYHGLPYDPTNYPADVWSYFAYSGESLVGTAASAARYSASATEDNAFFGVGAMLLCAMLGWWFWRRTLVKAALITAAVFVALSLGRSIELAGKDTGVPGPFQVLAKLPLGDLLVPTRFALIVVPVVALLLALGADRAITLPWRDSSGTPVRIIWAAAYAAALVPIIPTPVTVNNLAPPPAFIADGVWREYVPAGRTAIPVPIPSNRDMQGQTWSAETHNEMAIPAGYFLGPTSATDTNAYWGPPPRPTTELLNGVARTGEVPTITSADRRAAVEDLSYWRASVVVVGKQPHDEELRIVLNDLLGPGTQRAGVWLWDVRSLVEAE